MNTQNKSRNISAERGRMKKKKQQQHDEQQQTATMTGSQEPAEWDTACRSRSRSVPRGAPRAEGSAASGAACIGTHSTQKGAQQSVPRGAQQVSQWVAQPASRGTTCRWRRSVWEGGAVAIVTARRRSAVAIMTASPAVGFSFFASCSREAHGMEEYTAKTVRV